MLGRHSFWPSVWLPVRGVGGGGAGKRKGKVRGKGRMEVRGKGRLEVRGKGS